jgi:hypothetical protein
MIQPLTIKDASDKASTISLPSKEGLYTSTRDILKIALGKGWVLKDAVSHGSTDFKKHCAVLVHENTCSDDVALQQGYPQIYIWNTKQDLSYLIGWHNPTTKVDFITPKYFMQDNVFIHKKNNLSIEELAKKLDHCRVYYESINNSINEAKNRILTNMEMMGYANYATDIRYKKKKKPYSFNSFSLLNSTKIENENNNLWTITNIILDNIINGSKNGGNKIKGFKERLNFSWNMWQGFTACNLFQNEKLFHAFIEIANEV